MSIFPTGQAGRLLDRIDTPEQLSRLTVAELEQLAEELRAVIIATVTQRGGHLASSLGAIELTLALYSVFRLPPDKVVWDVGHQAYAHKILTGRRDAFAGLRQGDGITGFPCRAESPFDAFGVGHASTSISAALGMAIGRDLAGRGEHVIAVIGDGAMTGGMAFEALNHAGQLRKNLIVVLNDNGRSIDSNVGAMSEYLSRLRVNPGYTRAKRDLKELLRGIPHIGETVANAAEIIKDGVKAALIPGGFFTELGFTYLGPLDGHNLALMRDVFAEVRLMDGPVLVHVKTKKGKGYLPAELDPEKFHGVSPAPTSTAPTAKPPKYTDVFSRALLKLADRHPELVAITAAMPSGTGLKAFGERYPQRFFDVGIAEEHAVTLAAGLATSGLRPVVAIYSTFLQRAYDQMLHDVCLQNLPVIFCLDRAGLVGDDGPTHHGAFDLSYLRTMPNMTVMAPKDENELQRMLAAAVAHTDGPVAMRYPRGAGLGVPLDDEPSPLALGRAEVLQSGDDDAVALVAIGAMVGAATQVAALLRERGLNAAVVNARFAKPLDSGLLRSVAAKVKLLVTIEENALAGGFGSAVLELLGDSVPILRCGIPDAFIRQGQRDDLLALCGLLPAQIVERIMSTVDKP